MARATERGVGAVELFDADSSIPIHHDDYEDFRTPLSAVREAVGKADLEDRIEHVDRGDTYRFRAPTKDE